MNKKAIKSQNYFFFVTGDSPHKGPTFLWHPVIMILLHLISPADQLLCHLFLNLSSASIVHIRDLPYVITESTDALAPNNAGPSADTVMNVFNENSLPASDLESFFGQDYIIHNAW